MKRTERTPLTREAILREALAIVDEQGLGALSMRKLAAAVGVEAMSLYHHFPNKDRILGALVEFVIGEAALASPPPSADGDWRTMMREGIGLVRRATLAHPNVAPLLMGAYQAPEPLAWVEGPLRILKDAGFEGRGLVAAMHAISAYSFGWMMLAGDEGLGVWHDVRRPDGEIPAQAGPATRSAGEAIGDWSFGFEEGLDILLDGLDERRVLVAGES